MARQKMDAQGTEIALMVREREDYISLTGIAKYRNSAEPFAVINNWMRSRSTVTVHTTPPFQASGHQVDISELA